MNIIENSIKQNIIFDTSDEDFVGSNENGTNENGTNDNGTVENDNGTVENVVVDSAFLEYKKNIIKKNILLTANLKKGPSGGIIVIDNFYNNPLDTRKYILTQEFSVMGNYPGKRTISYANEHLKKTIQKYVEPFGGKITMFPIPKANKSDASTIYNGSFQYTTSRDRSWVHNDSWNNWAGVLFLTPDAPLSSGTAFYKFYDGTMSQKDGLLLNNKEETDKYSQDLTKWELVDQVGNVFNRLVLFDANRFHMSMDYFGNSKENGRLFQVFFFSTEK